MRIIIALLLTLLPSLAMAQESCTTSVAGQRIGLFYERGDDALAENKSYRESVLGGWGAIDCPGYATLRYLTPDLTDAQRGPFCLQWDRQAKTYAGYAEGPRDAYLRCRAPRRSFCERVNATANASLAIAGLAKPTPGNEPLVDGVTAVTRPGGAVVLSGAGAAVSETIAATSSSASVALATPVGMAAAAVTVVAVGGALYVCSE